MISDKDVAAKHVNMWMTSVSKILKHRDMTCLIGVLPSRKKEAKSRGAPALCSAVVVPLFLWFWGGPYALTRCGGRFLQVDPRLVEERPVRLPEARRKPGSRSKLPFFLMFSTRRACGAA